MIASSNPWLLPDGVSEVLPDQAWHLETLRRQLLDFYKVHGYELVMPPFIEYLESLLVGTGADLDLQTFKLTDQLTGRLMGIRADITPQVARIDAHRLKREAPSRLCYIGTVMQTRPDSLALSRTPIQVGAELFGYSNVAGDVEILNLMLETLRIAGIEDFHVDLGHVSIYRELSRQAALDASSEAQLFDAIQRKATPDVKQLLTTWQIEGALADMLLKLPELHGDISVLDEARQILHKASDTVHQAIDSLANLASQLPDYPLHFDLSELRGYSYYTGVVFAAYVANYGEAIARGGRYDDIGKVFGRARPATGFTTDLRTLATIGRTNVPKHSKIFAPDVTDQKLQQRITELREQGYVVIQALPGQVSSASEMECEQYLEKIEGDWQLQTIKG